MRNKEAAKYLDSLKSFSDVSNAASVPVCLEDCVLLLVRSFLQLQGKKERKKRERKRERKEKERKKDAK